MLSRKESNADIQWETSKNSSTPTWIQRHSVELCFFVTITFGILCEYFWSYGVIALSVAAFVSLLYQISAPKHDSIPSISMFYPVIGHFIWICKYYDSLYDRVLYEFLNATKKNNGKVVPMLSAAMPGNRSLVYVSDPLLVDIIYRKQFGDAIKDEAQYDTLRPLLGNGIFTSNGKVWKRHRAIASRMFTTRSLRDYMFKNFMETTDKLMDKCNELSKMNGKNGIDMYDMFLRLTFEAFTNTAFGINVNAIAVAPNVVPFANAFDKSLEICGTRFGNIEFIWKAKKWLDIGNEKELRKHCELMEAFIKDVVSKRKEYYTTLNNDGSNNNSDNDSIGGANRTELRKKYDLLSLFIKDNPDIDDKELRDITMNFIIAGRDTTAQNLTWLMYELTKTDENGNKVNGEVEAKIRKEIETVLAKHGESGVGNGLSYNSVNEMKYLEGALLEALRLYPSVPTLARKAVTDYNFGDITGDYKNYDYIIRKNDEILIPAWAMGRLPWVWDDALKFKPERFYDESTNTIIDYSGSKYPAFNLNPRMCLGKTLALLEAKICIVKLFTKYKNIQIVPNQNVTYVMTATNHLRNGMKLTLD